MARLLRCIKIVFRTTWRYYTQGLAVAARCVRLYTNFSTRILSKPVGQHLWGREGWRRRQQLRRRWRLRRWRRRRQNNHNSQTRHHIRSGILSSHKHRQQLPGYQVWWWDEKKDSRLCRHRETNHIRHGNTDPQARGRDSKWNARHSHRGSHQVFVVFVVASQRYGVRDMETKIRLTIDISLQKRPQPKEKRRWHILRSEFALLLLGKTRGGQGAHKSIRWVRRTTQHQGDGPWRGWMACTCQVFPQELRLARDRTKTGKARTAIFCWCACMYLYGFSLVRSRCYIVDVYVRKGIFVYVEKIVNNLEL